jgi:perosamine synthetase
MFDSLFGFIDEFYGHPADGVGLHTPQFTAEDEKYVVDCIRSSYVSSNGKYVDEVEERVSFIQSCESSVAVVNGTSGLHLALEASGVGFGHEVITQALTFVATSNAILYTGAVPVFVDIDETNLGISVEALESFLEENVVMREGKPINKSSGRIIKACVPVHVFGFIGDIERIVEVCEKYGIFVIEDAAEALGSSKNGIGAGGFGHCGVISFNGNKLVTSGGGGAIVSNDKEFAKRLKYLSATAKDSHPWSYFHQEKGFNYRMPNLNAALLCAQLNRVDKYIESKVELYVSYNKVLAPMNTQLIAVPKGCRWNHWLMTLKFEDRIERDRFLEESHSRKVFSRPVWDLMFRLPMFEHAQKDEQQVARDLESRLVNLPSWTLL